METLKGVLSGRQILHRVGHGGRKYLIHEFIDDDGNVAVVKGNMSSVAYGWRYHLHGEWEEGERGREFRFSSYTPQVRRDSKGIADYLARHLPTVGTRWAARIVDHLGDETLTILKESPDRLREVPGLSARMMDQIREFLASKEYEETDPTAYADLVNLLGSIRPPRKVYNALVRQFGSSAAEWVREHPYKLMDFPGIGWDRVDRLAINEIKYGKDGVERHEQAILEALARHAEQGHTRVSKTNLYYDTAALLGMYYAPEAMRGLLGRGEVVEIDNPGGDPWYARQDLREAERTIARRIAELQAAAGPIDLGDDFGGLTDEQAPIVARIEANGVCYLAGVPGSGKSYATGVVVRGLHRLGIEDILIVAPTGKAAKRDAELVAEFLPGVKVPCLTVHRALGLAESDEEEGLSKDDSKINRGRDPWAFFHNRDNPLPYRFFVIDECSMADVKLFASFLLAIPDGSRLLIVGDPDQLPSVGPGAVLRDLIASGLPGVTLEQPLRNSGDIARDCWLIKHGKVPRPSGDPKSNRVHREIATDEGILEFIVQLHINYVKAYGPRRAKEDLQVISPEKGGLLGCRSINAALAPIVNPAEDLFVPSVEWGQGDDRVSIRAGEKVIRNSKNRREPTLIDPEIPAEELAALFGQEEADAMEADGWRWDYDPIAFRGKEYALVKAQVVNGDIGEVAEIRGAGAFAKVLVRFTAPERLCMLTAAESHLVPAYCITYHKMQGSSAPWVILPLSKFYFNSKTDAGLWVRETVYTGWSRPTKKLITAGRLAELAAAVGRTTKDRRQTSLKEFMNNYLQEVAA